MITSHQYRNDSSDNSCTYKWYLTPCGRSREGHAEVDYETLRQDQAMKVILDSCFDNRTAFLIYVDLDPVLGTFHTPYSAYRSIQGMLNQSGVRQYTPIVALVSDNAPKNESGRKRACFILFVDLDPTPGIFHSSQSAQNAIRNLLVERIPHYNPMVSLAPEHLQPSML
jgi:hypothetical protein